MAEILPAALLSADTEHHIDPTGSFETGGPVGRPCRAPSGEEHRCAGLARRCTIQLACAIGVSRPLSLHVDTHGTGTVGDDELEEAIKGIEALGGLAPCGIRNHPGLNKPICRKKTDLIPDLRAALQA